MGAYRLPAKQLLDVTASIPEADRAEMAVPSYCHKNPLIRWLFWNRLDVALDLAQLKPQGSVLEFGIGSGVLLPSFCENNQARVVGVDIETRPAKLMSESLSVPVELVTAGDFPAWAERNSGAFDTIFALDVLEHVEVDELARLSKNFVALLRPGGRLIVSGPTESLAYKVGRFVAGFKNHYHHRNIFDIEQVLEQSWKASTVRRLPAFPLPQAFSITKYKPLGAAS